MNAEGGKRIQVVCVGRARQLIECYGIARNIVDTKKITKDARDAACQAGIVNGFEAAPDRHLSSIQACDRIEFDAGEREIDVLVRICTSKQI